MNLLFDPAKSIVPETGPAPYGLLLSVVNRNDFNIYQ
jgi:hypothetical protein